MQKWTFVPRDINLSPHFSPYIFTHPPGMLPCLLIKSLHTYPSSSPANHLLLLPPGPSSCPHPPAHQCPQPPHPTRAITLSPPSSSHQDHHPVPTLLIPPGPSPCPHPLPPTRAITLSPPSSSYQGHPPVPTLLLPPGPSPCPHIQSLHTCIPSSSHQGHHPVP